MRKNINGSKQKGPQLDIEFLLDNIDEIFNVCVGTDFCEWESGPSHPSFLDNSQSLDFFLESNVDSSFSEEFYDKQTLNLGRHQPQLISTSETTNRHSVCLTLNDYLNLQAKSQFSETPVDNNPLPNDVKASFPSLTKLSIVVQNKNKHRSFELYKTGSNQVWAKKIKQY